MARQKSHKKVLDDFLQMDKTGVDYVDSQNESDDKILEAYELHHSKEADAGHTGLETHLMGELHGKVKGFLKGETNFQHIEDEGERRKEATKFADELMMFSLEKYYTHSGKKPAEAKRIAQLVMSDPSLALDRGRKIFPGFGGRDGFIEYLIGFEGNLRDFIHPNNTELYLGVYHPIIKGSNPHNVRKEILNLEVQKKKRKGAVDEYFKKALGDEAEDFVVYEDTNRQILMELATDIKKGASLSKDLIEKYEKRHQDNIKKPMFTKIPEKYKSK